MEINSQEDLIQHWNKNPDIAAMDIFCRDGENVQLPPHQRIILRDLWLNGRKFSLLIMARGSGKTATLAMYSSLRGLLLPNEKCIIVSSSYRQCLTENNLVLTENGFKYISQITPNDKVLSREGINEIDHVYETKALPTLRVTSKHWYSVEGAYDHKILIMNENCDFEYRKINELDKKDWIIVNRGTNVWSKEDTPLPRIEKFKGLDDSVRIPKKITPELAYIIGYMQLGNFRCDDDRYRITTNRDEVMSVFEKTFKKIFNIKIKFSPYGEKKKLRRERAIINHITVNRFFDAVGVSDKTKVPDCILHSSKEVVTAYLEGLFEQSGRAYVSYRERNDREYDFMLNTSNLNHCQQIKTLLLNYGIISGIKRNLKHGIFFVNIKDKKSLIRLYNNFSFTSEFKQDVFDDFYKDIRDDDELKYDYIPYSGKLLRKIIDNNPGVFYNAYKFRTIAYRIKNSNTDHFSYYFVRDFINIFGKIFDDLGKYDENLEKLKEIEAYNYYYDPVKFIEDTGIQEVYDISVPEENCYTAGGLINHNSQFVFDEVMRLWDESPLFKESSEKAPSRGPNECKLTLRNGSLIAAYPIGDGSKIRGIRANTLVIDETAQVDPTILDMVVKPFLITSQNPMKQNTDRDNTVVMASTAYFQFNHLYNKYEDYLRRTNKNSEIYDPKYSLHLYTIDDMPKGWIDRDMLEEQRISMPKVLFDMEYYCLPEWTEIHTDKGFKPIENVNKEDKVLTHRGRLREIEGVSSRECDDDLITIDTEIKEEIQCTPEHPILLEVDDKPTWTIASMVEVGDRILYPLKTKDHFNVKDFRLGDFAEYIPYLWFDDENGIRRISISRNNYKYMGGKKYRGKVRKTKNLIPYFISPEHQLIRLIIYYYFFGKIIDIKGKFNSRGKTQGKQLKTKFRIPVEYSYIINDICKCMKEIFNIDDYNIKTRVNNISVVFEDSQIIRNLLDAYANIAEDIPTFFNENFTKRFTFQLTVLCLSLMEYEEKVDGRNGDTSVSLKLRFEDKQKAYIARNALFAYNIFPAIKKKYVKGRKLYYDLVVNDKDSYRRARHMYYKFGIGTKQNEKWAEVNEKLVNKGSNIKKKIYKPDLYISIPVSSVDRKEFEGKVYNLRVKQDNSYTTKGFAVHNCVFPKDTDGFFPASLLHSVQRKNCQIETEGYGESKYFFGIDPARTKDNFCLAVVKMGMPMKLVGLYTMNDESYQKMVEFIRQKYLDYHKRGSKVEGIYIDKGGGGETLRDLLAEEYIWYDKDGVKHVEQPLLEIDNDDHKHLTGENKVRLVIPNNENINAQNFDLKADMEQRRFIIPSEPGSNKTEVDEIFDEVLEFITEITNIVTRQLKNNYLNFDTPKGRQRKDRYSAVLLATFGARNYNRKPKNEKTKKLPVGFAKRGKPFNLS